MGLSMEDDLKGILCEMKGEINVFNLLDGEEIGRISSYFELMDYPKGTVLFEEGEPGDFIGIVKSGMLGVEKQTEFEGKKIVLAQYTRGSFIGELAVFDRLPRSATVTAVEDSELLILSREALDSFMEIHPHTGISILKGLIRVLSIRLRKSADRLATIF
jgi:CRP-like cAMP-binding protein